MSPVPAGTWHDANQRHLLGALARVRQALLCAAGLPDDEPPELEAPWEEASVPALTRITAAFRLSPFERDLLLLCAGPELDSGFAALCAAAHGDPLAAYPTFSLALAALPDGHWSALTPEAPLRRWRLIEVGHGPSLTRSPLRIDEWALHYLAGVPYRDPRLAPVLRDAPPPADLSAGQIRAAERAARMWATHPDAPAAVQFSGGDRDDARAVASTACAVLHCRLAELRADALPHDAAELETLARLWEREATLGALALLVHAEGVDSSDRTRGAAARFLEAAGGPIAVWVPEGRLELGRSSLTLELPQLDAEEQRAAWEAALGPELPRLNGRLEALFGQFRLGPGEVRTAAAEAVERTREVESADLGRELWAACRVRARTRMDELAIRIEPAAAWDDLVLPEAQRETLRQIARHVRGRDTVYNAWGFGNKGERGLGISALFAGPSGTGKTMAAEVLARELELDLYHIDLSALVSKYIGETEKNLRRVFDAAERGGAILLFDEADALFGKRSEVKDSHDRYANIEVSYLLQRMECYRGLAILTTNMKSALDTAFLRRLRFVVQFPFPDAAGRAEIWRRIFPRETPTERLVPERLAQLNVTGGNIRSIALNAAFLAADAREPVRMKHLLRAARAEYGKLERPLTDAETTGWSED